MTKLYGFKLVSVNNPIERTGNGNNIFRWTRKYILIYSEFNVHLIYISIEIALKKRYYY